MFNIGRDKSGVPAEIWMAIPDQPAHSLVPYIDCLVTYSLK